MRSFHNCSRKLVCRGAPQLLVAALVSGNGFEVLSMKPYLGRLLTLADDVRGGPAEGWPVVLSYAFWKDNFGADPSLVGKQIKLANTIVTGLGVAPPNFRGVWPGSETNTKCKMVLLDFCRHGATDAKSRFPGTWNSRISTRTEDCRSLSRHG